MGTKNTAVSYCFWKNTLAYVHISKYFKENTQKINLHDK
jgi:hypothetical protein